MNNNDKAPWISDELKDELKKETDMVALLQFFGAAEIKPGSGEGQYKSKCIFPDCKPAKKNDLPFGFNDEKKNFNCFHCGRGGDVLKLVMLVRGCSFYQAKQFLLEWNRGNTREDIQSAMPKQTAIKPEEPKRKITFKPFRKELTGLRVDGVLAIEEKGITPETARKFGVGYCSQGFMKGRVVVPVHDSTVAGTDPENILFYAGYSITKKQKEYGDWKFPDDCPKGSHLFNLNRLLVESKQMRETISRHGVIVVESFWNVLKLNQAGIKNVVALMGKELTFDQEKLLLGFTDRLKLWLDTDPEGRKALQGILRHPKGGGRNGLLYKTHVQIIDPAVKIAPEENQAKPYHFSKEEIKKILG